MVFCIAALHALFPILGALLGGKKGLSVGIVLGLVSAVCLGAIVFTVPDLIGLGLGCLIAQPIAENLPQGGLGKILQWAAFSIKIVCYVVFGATLVGVLGYVAWTCLNDWLTTDTLEASKRELNAIRAMAIAPLEADCRRNDPVACRRLGIKRIQETKDVLDARSVEAFRKGCELNDGESCSRYASVFEYRDLATKKRIDFDSRVAALYLKACQLKNAGGCGKIARYHETGRPGFEQSLQKALLYFELARDYSRARYYDGDIRRVQKKIDNPYRYDRD